MQRHNCSVVVGMARMAHPFLDDELEHFFEVSLQLDASDGTRGSRQAPGGCQYLISDKLATENRTGRPRRQAAHGNRGAVSGAHGWNRAAAVKSADNNEVGAGL